MRTVTTRAGHAVPRMGLGTWRMGERADQRAQEVRALREGMDLGMTLIDTAEMYAEGGAEEVVADAIDGRRDQVYLVSKVLPHNASRRGTILAAENSLKRLKTEVIDLYLLHWEGSHPLQDTLAAFQELQSQGKIRSFGVSNFDWEACLAFEELPGGDAVAVNQVLYNLGRRGIEHRLLPRCRERGIAVMAYSPLEQGRLEVRSALQSVAKRHGVTPEQVALAWCLRHDHVIAIPKASHGDHVRQNAAAEQLELSEQDFAELDAECPPPTDDVPLETL